MKVISSFNTEKINSLTMPKAHRPSPMFKSSEIDSFEKALESPPPEYILLFEKVKNLEGKDFVKESYSGLIDILGIKSVASNKIHFPIFNWLVPAEAKAAANPSNASITVYKGLLKEKDKWEQFSIVAHEALHLKQYADILRLEDVDKESYIDAVTDLTYPLASEEQKKELRDGIAYGVNQFQKKAEKLGIIKKDSEKGVHTQKLYDALINYPRLEGSTIEQYLQNSLEVEAYCFEEQVYNWAKQYGNYVKK